LRSLSIAMPSQLSLDVAPTHDPALQRWSTLPGPAREQVLVLLARLIAREVLAAEEADR
jgi:hypothetical protein